MAQTFFIENLRQVKLTLNRFFAILIITALGVAFFAGLQATGPAMRQTGEIYLNDTNFMDIQILSTVGFNEEDVRAVQAVSGVKQTASGYSADVLLKREADSPAVKLISLSDSINKPDILEGKLPQVSGECLVDLHLMEEYSLAVGDTVTFESGNKDPLSDTIKQSTYLITGAARSPLYMSEDRGSSTVGSGQTEGFFYVPAQDFALEVYTELYITVENKQNIERFDDAYESVIQPVEDALEAVGKERAPIRYQEIIKEAQDELDDAKIEVRDGYKELDDAQNELDDANKKLTEARADLQDGQQEYEDGKATFDQEMADAETEIARGQREYTKGLQSYEKGLKVYRTQSKQAEAEFAQAEQLLASKEIELQQAEEALEQATNEYEGGQAQLSQGRELWQSISGLLAAGNTPEAIGGLSTIANQIQGMHPELAATLLAYTQNPEDPQMAAAANGAVAQFGATLDASEKQLADAKREMEQGYEQLEAGRAEMEAARQQIAEGRLELATAKKELEQAQRQLAAAKKKLDSGQRELEKGRQEGENELREAQSDIEEGRKELEDAQAEYEDGKEEYETESKDARVDLKEAKEKIAEGEQELADLKEAKWYVLNNETNPGFVSLKQDTQRLDAISAVIPVFFFMLAVFVTMTSMTRLVESDRGYIGTIKALGYGDGAVAARYLFYSASASLIGAVIGLVVGYMLLPPLIFDTYKLLYTLPDLYWETPVALSVLSVVLAVASTTVPAYIVVLQSVHEKPSELMRPEAPQEGKRILLERIPFIWKRLNFMQKVTMRNIFRYKKRLFMTLIGVAGCTALMFTGFAIEDAISTIVPKQYDEIFSYDVQVGYTADEQEDVYAALLHVEDQPEVQKGMAMEQLAVDAIKEDMLVSTVLVVPEDATEMEQFIHLHSRRSGDAIPLSDNGVVLSEKLAKLLDIKKGENIVLRDADANEANTVVSAINENYIGHYVYMTKDSYEQLFGQEFTPNQGLYDLTDIASEQAEKQFSSRLMQLKNVSAVSYVSADKHAMENTVEALYIIVFVLVVSAAALIFVVLFSLISINIEERNRELATLKVLGFYDNELASYIYRESNILTVMGIVLGIGLGILLQRFILGTMESNFMMFSQDILWTSYAFSAGLTGLFAFIVNALMRRHFREIDMISSLKSVE